MAGWMGQSLRQYLAQLASSAPTPGGGSAAALTGALAAALGHMVIAVATERRPTPERLALLSEFQALEGRFLASAADDERAFATVMEAIRLPKGDPARAERLQTALADAADVPLQVAETALSLLGNLREAEPHASRAIASDVGVAAHLALASLCSSLLNVRANTESLADAAIRERLENAAARLHAAARATHADTVRRVAEHMTSSRQ